MIFTDVGSYTTGELDTALYANVRTVRFRYQIMDNLNTPKGLLAGVQEGGTVAHNYLAEIKRTGRFTFQEDFPLDIDEEGWINTSSIDFQRDRMKVHFQLLMPDGLWASWPIGVFLLDSTSRRSVNGRILRAIEAYDLTKQLLQDKISTRFNLPQGGSLVGNVQQQLKDAGFPDSQQDITVTPPTAAAARSWDPGTSRLTIINDLLQMMNYRSIFFDENGIARSMGYIVPADRNSEWTYATDEQSVLTGDAEDIFDLFETPNVWTLVVSQPDRPELIATYTNASATSPTSTVNRGRIITDFRTDDDSSSQAVLNQRVRTMAHEASQVMRHVKFGTPLMPWHGDNNVYMIIHNTLGISDKFSEVAWEMTLKPGAIMTHDVRRVINIDA